MMAKTRILLVEDDETLREVVAEALREDGYDVQLAADGHLALELAERWQPKLVILDLMMPHMDGEEFSSAVRQVRGLEEVPIIIVSASRYTAEVGARVAADATLRKPFDLFELTERVSELLR
jgi:DNA-binding response OmpR family regulator